MSAHDALTKVQQQRLDLARDYHHTFMTTDHGRRVYEDIVHRLTNVYGPLKATSEHDTTYNVGRRDVGVAIFQLTEGGEARPHEHDPKIVTK